MSFSRSALARQANEKALEVRQKAGADFRSPLNVYDLCDSLGVKVQFVDVASMEGVLVRRGGSTIMISALRPAPRRVFTCAHELGHHVFGHRAPIDQITDRIVASHTDPNEFLADAFGGFLLMPRRAVTRAFVSRGWDHATAGPAEYYTVACAFGVGYETLVTHVAYGLRLVDSARAAVLGRAGLPAIRSSLLGQPTSDPLIVVDQQYAQPTVDVEAGTLLLLPGRAEPEGGSGVLEVVADVLAGRLVRALRPGLARIHIPGDDWAVVARVSRHQYVGLARYRHLEDDADEVDDVAEGGNGAAQLATAAAVAGR
jgi:Zn-dependent peptidase ImmA (M78 family)